eukprot:987198-Rhodomonas_salina.1
MLAARSVLKQKGTERALWRSPTARSSAVSCAESSSAQPNWWPAEAAPRALQQCCLSGTQPKAIPPPLPRHTGCPRRHLQRPALRPQQQALRAQTVSQLGPSFPVAWRGKNARTPPRSFFRCCLMQSQALAARLGESVQAHADATLDLHRRRPGCCPVRRCKCQ